MPQKSAAKPSRTATNVPGHRVTAVKIILITKAVLGQSIEEEVVPLTRKKRPVPTAVKKQIVLIIRQGDTRLEPVADFRKQSEFKNASKAQKASKANEKGEEKCRKRQQSRKHRQP